ncbi:hypothetical protein BZA77DRAFT_359592 [Pyronema omphalodes]|nr:hypothetical protein BZA77DRAFT_359592 [Pyronema omphalodes]
MSSKPPIRRAALVTTPEIINPSNEPTLILPQNFETELQDRDAEVNKLYSEIIERNQELIRLNKTVVDLQCVMSQMDHGIWWRDGEIKRLEKLLRMTEETCARRDKEIWRMEEMLRDVEVARGGCCGSCRGECFGPGGSNGDKLEANRMNDWRLDGIQEEGFDTVIQKRDAMDRELELQDRLDGYLKIIKDLQKELEALRLGYDKERQFDWEGPLDSSVSQGERVKLDTTGQVKLGDLVSPKTCKDKKPGATKGLEPHISTQAINWRNDHREFKNPEPQTSTDNMLAIRRELTATRNPELRPSTENTMVLRRERRASIKPEPHLSVKNQNPTKSPKETNNPDPAVSPSEPPTTDTGKLRPRHQFNGSKYPVSPSHKPAPFLKSNPTPQTSHVETIRRKLELLRTRNEEPQGPRPSRLTPATDSESRVSARRKDNEPGGGGKRLPKWPPTVASKEPVMRLSNWIKECWVGIEGKKRCGNGG